MHHMGDNGKIHEAEHGIRSERVQEQRISDILPGLIQIVPLEAGVKLPPNRRARQSIFAPCAGIPAAEERRRNEDNFIKT